MRSFRPVNEIFGITRSETVGGGGYVLDSTRRSSKYSATLSAKPAWVAQNGWLGTKGWPKTCWIVEYSSLRCSGMYSIWGIPVRGIIYQEHRHGFCKAVSPRNKERRIPSPCIGKQTNEFSVDVIRREEGGSRAPGHFTAGSRSEVNLRLITD